MWVNVMKIMYNRGENAREGKKLEAEGSETESTLNDFCHC